MHMNTSTCFLQDFCELFPEATSLQLAKIQTSYCSSCHKDKGLEKIGYYSCESCAKK